MEGRGGSGWRVRSQWVVPIGEVVNTGAAEALNYAGAAPVFATERRSEWCEATIRREVVQTVGRYLPRRSRAAGGGRSAHERLCREVAAR